MNPQESYMQYNGPAVAFAPLPPGYLQPGWPEYNDPARNVAPFHPAYLQPTWSEYQYPIDPITNLPVFPEESDAIFEDRQAIENPPNLTFRFEGVVYHAVRQAEGLPEPAEVINVKRFKVKEPRRKKHRDEYPDYYLPRISVTKQEMDAIRVGHAANPSPSLRNKPPNFGRSINISLSEVASLNEYRRQHGGNQVLLKHKRENDPEFRAIRESVSVEYDRKIQKRASKNAQRDVGVDHDNN